MWRKLRRNYEQNKTSSGGITMDIKVNLNNLTEDERNTLLSLVEKGNKPKNKIWKPKYDEGYYASDSSGAVLETTWNTEIDEQMYDIGNCFKTKKEAEFEVERLKVIAELKRYAQEHNECEVDWSNANQFKYYLYYSYALKKFFLLSVI